MVIPRGFAPHLAHVRVDLRRDLYTPSAMVLAGRGDGYGRRVELTGEVSICSSAITRGIRF